MSAGAGTYRYDAVNTLIDRLLSVTNIDDIVEDDTTVTVHGINDVGRRTKARDNNRHPVPDTHFHIMLEPVIALMNDLINGKWGDGNAGILTLVRRQLLGYLRQPLIEHRFGTGVERRKSTNNPCLTLCQYQFGSRDDKHRCPDRRNAQRAID